MTGKRLKLQEKAKEGSDRSISDTLLLFTSLTPAEKP